MKLREILKLEDLEAVSCKIGSHYLGSEDDAFTIELETSCFTVYDDYNYEIVGDYFVVSDREGRIVLELKLEPRDAFDYNFECRTHVTMNVTLQGLKNLLKSHVNFGIFCESSDIQWSFKWDDSKSKLTIEDDNSNIIIEVPSSTFIEVDKDTNLYLAIDSTRINLPQNPKIGIPL